jgi:hypothetical protein
MSQKMARFLNNLNSPLNLNLGSHLLYVSCYSAHNNSTHACTPIRTPHSNLYINKKAATKCKDYIQYTQYKGAMFKYLEELNFSFSLSP